MFLQSVQKALRQFSHVSKHSNTYGIQQSFFFPALAVSIVLHGVALALWSNAFISDQKNIPQSTNLSSSTPENTIIVTLTSLPYQYSENSQIHLPISHKQHISTRVSSRKPTSGKSVKSKLLLKSVALVKQFSNNKKTKITQHQTAKELDQRPKKHDILLNNNSNQRIETSPKLMVADKSDSLIAKSTTQVNSAVPLFSALKSTNKPPAASVLLPPVLRSREPEYPEEARWEERIGKVTLKFKISEQGHAINTHVADSSGHRDLDLAAIQFWQFDNKEGQAFDQWYHYSFRFELN